MRPFRTFITSFTTALLAAYTVIAHQAPYSRYPLLSVYVLYSSIILLSACGLSWLRDLKPESNARSILCHFSSAAFFASLSILVIATLLNPGTSDLISLAQVYAISMLGITALVTSADATPTPLNKTSNFDYSHAGLVAVSITFILSRLLMPLLYSGTYIDEYFHILSGTSLVESGKFAAMYSGEQYLRSPYISMMAGALIDLFGKHIYAIKMIPVGAGILNFFLAYKIATRLYKERRSVLLFLASYSVNPLVLLNHFYIRFNVFYESITLLLLYLFATIDEAYKNKQSRSAIRHTVGAVALAASNYFLNGDSLRYLGILLCFVYLTYFVVFNARKTIYEYLKKNKGAAISLCILLFGIIIVAISAFKNDFQQVFIGTLHDEQTVQANSYTFNGLFFNLSASFTILFLASLGIYIRHGKVNNLPWLPSIAYMLFGLHVLSSPNLKIIRGLFYFIPIYYLVAYKTLEELSIKPLHRTVFGFLMLASIASAYPAEFFSQPQIKNDLNYQDYKRAFLYMKDRCSDTENIGLIHFPDIAYFYNVRIDRTNYIFHDLLEKDARYVREGESFVTSFKHIAVNEDKNLLDTLQMSGQKKCIITYREYSDAYRYIKKSDFERLGTFFQRQDFTNFSVYYQR